MLDSELEVSEFELQSHYYVHFRFNAIGKSIKILINLIIG